MEDENTSRYKDRSKNPRRGVQMAPKQERVFGVQRPIWHIWSAERHIWSAKKHSKRDEFSFVGFWPNGLWVMIMHTFFNLFVKGCVQIHTLIFHAYCGARQFVDQAHLPLEILKAQSEQSCVPSSTTQSTRQFLGGSRGQFSPRQILNPPRIKG